MIDRGPQNCTMTSVELPRDYMGRASGCLPPQCEYGSLREDSSRNKLWPFESTSGISGLGRNVSDDRSRATIQMALAWCPRSRSHSRVWPPGRSWSKTRTRRFVWTSVAEGGKSTSKRTATRSQPNPRLRTSCRASAGVCLSARVVTDSDRLIEG